MSNPFSFPKFGTGQKGTKIPSLNKNSLMPNAPPQSTFQSQIHNPMKFTAQPKLGLPSDKKAISLKQSRFLAIKRMMGSH